MQEISNVLTILSIENDFFLKNIDYYERIDVFASKMHEYIFLVEFLSFCLYHLFDYKFAPSNKKQWTDDRPA